MKVIFRKSTVQFTDENETVVMTKDNPDLWNKVRESMEKLFQENGVELPFVHDKLTNQIELGKK